MTKLVLPLICSLFITATACKKNDPAPNQSKTELLTAHDWKRSGMQMIVRGFPVDVWQLVSACQKDDVIKFNRDQTTNFKVNTPCPGDVNRNGTWNFSNNDAKLTIIDPGADELNGTFDIVELTESTLKISGTYTDSNGTGTAVMIFSR